MYAGLAPFTLIECSAFVAAPSAGMTLAQMGADVVRVDPIGGGLDYRRWPVSKESGASFYWSQLNKGKRSIQVDLSKPEGRELVQALATQPGDDKGVLLTNFATARWLSQDVLAEKRADVISAAVQGNPDGSTAVDYTINAAVGYPDITGSPDMERPVNHVMPVWDFTVGLQAALGVIAAIDHRRRTGEGQRVSVALSDMAIASVANLGQIAEVEINGAPRGRSGNDVYGTFGRDFETLDGRRVMLVAITARQWQGLCRITGISDKVKGLEAALDADFSDEGQRYEWRVSLFKLVEDWTRTKTLSEIGSLLDEAGLAWGPYQTVEQMLKDDKRASTENPMLERVAHPGVPETLTPGLPIFFQGMERAPVKPAPVLGAHTDQVLAEMLGLSSGAIGKLHDGGIVAGSE